MNNDEWEPDPLFDQAISFVIDKQNASISGVQRQFRIGYNRAARIIEQMEEVGVVSEQGHDGNRAVLFEDIYQWIEYCKEKNSDTQNIDMTNVILWPGTKK